ncbi:hypothetical protein ACFLXU_06310 [Chloroflexota bacterium]
MTKVGILDKALNYEEQTEGYPSININIYKTLIITVNSKEVAWLFGVDNTVVEQWVNAGTLTPCSKTPDGIKLFLRKDVADLLATFGA